MAASCAKYSGRAGRFEVICATKSSRVLICSAQLVSRSVPMVDELSARMLRPQSEPAPCAGYTSVLSGSVISLWCSESNIMSASCCGVCVGERSGRPTSPMNSVSPVNTAQGSSPCSQSVSTRQTLSGVWPGVSSAVRQSVADLQLEAVMQRDVLELRARGRADVDLRAGSLRQLPVAGDEVGMQVRLEDVADREAVLLRGFEVDLDIALRIDDHRLALASRTCTRRAPGSQGRTAGST